MARRKAAPPCRCPDVDGHLRRSDGRSHGLLRHGRCLLHPGPAQVAGCSPARCAMRSASIPSPVSPESSRWMASQPRRISSICVTCLRRRRPTTPRQMISSSATKVCPRCRRIRASHWLRPPCGRPCRTCRKFSKCRAMSSSKNTEEGLDISLIDQDGRSMFAEGGNPAL